jgi:hypothetical protein
MAAAGLGESELAHEMNAFLEAMGTAVFEIALEASGLMDAGAHRLDPVAPPWFSQVFPRGIDLEIRITEKDGRRSIEKTTLPVPPRP